MQESLTQEQRILLKTLLREIENIESGIMNTNTGLSGLHEIINQAQTVINNTDAFFVKDRALYDLTKARDLILKYENNNANSVYDLIDITNNVYVVIESFLIMSPLPSK